MNKTHLPSFFINLFRLMVVFPVCLYAMGNDDALDVSRLCSYGLSVPTEVVLSKQVLHAEFRQKASISGLVSYLYYPYYGDQGHAELEVEGLCRAFKGWDNKIRSLDRKKSNRLNGRGLPFYRYSINVTPDELSRLRLSMDSKSFYSFVCSLTVLNVLAKEANFSIPFIFRLSPLISANYLSGMKKMGLQQRIKNIDFYGTHKRSEQDRIRLGVTREVLSILLAIGGPLAGSVYFWNNFSSESFSG